MHKIRKAFTLWYIKRGYTFGYDISTTFVYRDDDPVAIPERIPNAIWDCPWWVRPLLIFFSPSVYQTETVGKALAEGFAAGLAKGMKGE